MTYELAKQLKDAAFPGSQNWWDMKDHFVETPDHEEQPTLSELIKECGSGFGKLVRVSEKAGFWAYPPDVTGIGLPGVQEGPTPEEAVAKLWLSLNTDSKVKAVDVPLAPSLLP
jgi:hypothetical protein